MPRGPSCGCNSCPTCTNRIKARRLRERRAAQGLPRARNYPDALICLDADPCVYCGADGETWDHIVPRSRGGSNDVDNYSRACRVCNSSKHDRSLLIHLLVLRIDREIDPLVRERIHALGVTESRRRFRA